MCVERWRRETRGLSDDHEDAIATILDAESAPCSPNIAFLLRPVKAPYMRSLSRQLLMMGTQSASNSCKASQAVSMARESQDVYTASTANP